MESEFKKVHEGPRWRLNYGSFCGLERTAVVELQKILQYYLPYPLVLETGAKSVSAQEHLAVIGTAASNPLIAELLETGKLPAATAAEGYSIALMDSPKNPKFRLLVVAGFDERGLLYAAQEAAARLFNGGTLLDGFGGAERRKHLELMEPFSVQEAPAVRNRGLWTWGYPITSYRRYFDNMMRLKMNLVTIWNV